MRKTKNDFWISRSNSTTSFLGHFLSVHLKPRMTNSEVVICFKIRIVCFALTRLSVAQRCPIFSGCYIYDRKNIDNFIKDTRYGKTMLQIIKRVLYQFLLITIIKIKKQTIDTTIQFTIVHNIYTACYIVKFVCNTLLDIIM